VTGDSCLGIEIPAANCHSERSEESAFHRPAAKRGEAFQVTIGKERWE
jgi:hypothetical protein